MILALPDVSFWPNRFAINLAAYLDQWRVITDWQKATIF
jgi:hypothetical protein